MKLVYIKLKTGGVNMKILLLRTWLTNIGNGFIEKGAEVCIRRAFPNSDIIEVSGFPNYVGYYDGLGIKSQLLGTSRFERFKKRLYKLNKETTLVNIAEIINDVDVAILAGCILDTTLVKYMPTLRKLQENDVPILFIGAGGSSYTTSTSECVQKIINELKPVALLTRDTVAYNLYSRYFDFSYDGIDCGFFINEYHYPPKAKEPFVVATFDSRKEPKIMSNYPIIRAYHEPFYYANMHNILFRISAELSTMILGRHYKKIPHKECIVISDNIKDYLFLYANAEEVHSDRVHACVAALSYGKRAKFYADTPRAALFDKLLDKEITDGLSSLSRCKLEDEKEKQVSALKEAISRLL